VEAAARVSAIMERKASLQGVDEAILPWLPEDQREAGRDAIRDLLNRIGFADLPNGFVKALKRAERAMEGPSRAERPERLRAQETPEAAAERQRKRRRAQKTEADEARDLALAELADDLAVIATGFWGPDPDQGLEPDPTLPTVSIPKFGKASGSPTLAYPPDAVFESEPVRPSDRRFSRPGYSVPVVLGDGFAASVEDVHAALAETLKRGSPPKALAAEFKAAILKQPTARRLGDDPGEPGDGGADGSAGKAHLRDEDPK
jgi:hypothetical protein